MRHTFVRLFLGCTHLKNPHQGLDYLRSKVQERYSILKLSSAMGSIKSKSVLCRKFRAATNQMIMAYLQNERLAYQSAPFTNTGADYSGPFYVTVCRTTEMRWGVLFNCLTTRAVHVEVVSSLDTSSCVMEVEWFVSRRGMPAIIWSDNGTNFIGAEKKIRESIENETRSTSPRNLHIKALRGGSIRQVRHTKAACGRSWSVVLRGYCTPSSIHVASQMR